MGKTIKVALSTVSMVWAMAWCGGGGEGAYDRNAPYGAYTMTTVWEADLTRLDGTTGVFAGRLTSRPSAAAKKRSAISGQLKDSG